MNNCVTVPIFASIIVTRQVEVIYRHGFIVINAFGLVPYRRLAAVDVRPPCYRFEYAALKETVRHFSPCHKLFLDGPNSP